MAKSTEKTYSGLCSCFGSGSISLSVQIDKDACRIGDSIAVTVQVNNQSNKRVRAIRVRLYQIVNNYVRAVGEHIYDRNVQATGSFSWNGCLPVSVFGVSIDIPAMRLSHILEVTVVVAFASNVAILLPVKVVMQGTNSLEAIQSYVTGVLGPMVQQPNPAVLPDYPPPEYQLPPEMTTWNAGASAPPAQTADNLNFKKCD